MKVRIFIVAFLVLGVITSVDAQSQKGYTLKVKIDGLQATYLVMRHMENGVDIPDTAKAVKGIYSFKGRVDEPADMAIVFSPEAKFQKVFYVENKPLEMTGSTDALNKLTVKGSTVQDDYAKLEKEVEEFRMQVQGMFNRVDQARQAGMPREADSLEAKAREWYAKEYDIHKRFVTTHLHSYASLNELLNLINAENIGEMRGIYDQLDESLKSTKKAKEIQERFANLELTKIGNAYVDFIMNDVSGNQVSLSSITGSGKYVLLEFWASWCGPCRAENPNLREQYEKYNKKGFEILGVSLDSKSELWKKAIEKDSLTWIQVSDLKGWNNEAAVQYAVRAIPANFLISPEGKIIGRDLRDKELNEKLSSLFD